MIPRQRLDIEWSDLAAGVWSCLGCSRAEQHRTWIETKWGAPRSCLVSLSVRSGFDALLSVLDLPPGSEVIVSALTIRDMVRIIEDHRLIAVPVDIDIRQLSVDPTRLQRAMTPRTRAVLIAHLFGARMPLDEIARAARQHHLLVIEDCAQAYCGDDFRGSELSDVACFSFGPIKTGTALGGGILCFRDPELCRHVRERQSRWPLQSHWEFFRRVLKYSVLKVLNSRIVFTVCVAICRLLRIDHDGWLGSLVRGFGRRDFFSRIRRCPSLPLISLLARRLRQQSSANIDRRKRLAQAAQQLVPSEFCIGQCASFHSHWVFPIQVPDPVGLMRHLWTAGFDATRGASSMIAVNPALPDQARALNAERLMNSVLYLPVATCRSEQEVARLSANVNQFQQTHSAGCDARSGK